jgi:hypothetical protein
MPRALATLAVLAALLGVAAGVASGASEGLTPAQLVARFKARTGTTLAVDKRGSYPGHYTALGVSQSISNLGRYGRFTIWVVTSGAEDDVLQLLVDAHTGELGTPGPASIYWEHGTALTGGSYWLAKKRYGADVVLWWYGSERHVDTTFRRLHRPLSAILAQP